MNKKRFSAINFDLDTKKLKKFYVSLTGNRYNQAYYDIKSYMKENGFSHRQGSGYISKNPITEIAAVVTIKNMGAIMPWLRDCTNRIDLTVVGNQFDLSEALNSESNDVIDNPVKGSKVPVTIQSSKSNSLDSYDKSKTPKEQNYAVLEEYDVLQKKYGDLIKEYNSLLKVAKQNAEAIDTTNAILNANPQLKESFREAKQKFLQEAEKEKNISNNKPNQKRDLEHKPKSHKR